MSSLIRRITETNEQMKQTRNRLIDAGNKLVASREGKGWGMSKIGEGESEAQTFQL